METQAPLSVAELATLEAVDGPCGHNTASSEMTASLISLGFIEARSTNLYVTQAGRSRLATERLLIRDRRSPGRGQQQGAGLKMEDRRQLPRAATLKLIHDTMLAAAPTHKEANAASSKARRQLYRECSPLLRSPAPTGEAESE